jgi:hypothetical protein
MFAFVFDGRKIAQGGVATCGIVEAFDELKDGHPRLAVRSEATSIDQLAFEGGEETLAHRIVVGVADRACRWTNAGLLAAIAESDRRVLGGFKRSSQHLNVGGCDDPSKALIPSFRAGAVAIARTAASSEAI